MVAWGVILTSRAVFLDAYLYISVENTIGCSAMDKVNRYGSWDLFSYRYDDVV